MGIRQFTKYGFAIKPQATITGTFSIHEISSHNAVKLSSDIPSSVYLDSVEISVAAGAAAGDELTMFLARDPAGDLPLTSTAPGGATQAVTLGLTTATVGAYNFTINKDFHFDDFATGSSTRGKLYVVAKCVDSGGSGKTITANIRLNWRG
tara:strand:+ start:1832 stop:2284 length:453 start_codon:yes stop_codon:yes gene_type:complete